MRFRALVPVLMLLAVLSVAILVLARSCVRRPDPASVAEQQPSEQGAAAAQCGEGVKETRDEGQDADNRKGATGDREAAPGGAGEAPVREGIGNISRGSTAGSATPPGPAEVGPVPGAAGADTATAPGNANEAPGYGASGTPIAVYEGIVPPSAPAASPRGGASQELNSSLRVADTREILAGTVTHESSREGAAAGVGRAVDGLANPAAEAQASGSGLQVDAPVCQPVFTARLDSRAKRGLGATAATEASVEVALDWLAAQQNTDGSWTVDWLDVPYSSGPTGLVLLAFLGAGVTHVGVHKHQLVAARSVTWLLVNAGSGTSPRLFPQRTFYEQVLATAAVCEAFGMTGDSRLRLLAEEAVALVFARQGTNGGFGYNGPGADVHVTGLATTLARSAAAAGVPVPGDAWKRLRAFWCDAVNPDGTTSYVAGGAPGIPTSARTALGCLALSLTDGSRERLATSRRTLSMSGPQATDFFQLWYGTDALKPTGGLSWQQWFSKAIPRLLHDQRRDGRWDGRYGPTVSTALAALTMEGFYRYAQAPSAASGAGAPVVGQ